MRFRLQTNLKKKAIENGENIQPNKAASCGRELLKSIARALILWSPSNIEQKMFVLG
jgi:hypothetical protein